MPAFRSARALIYAELGRLEDARADFELQAGDEFSGIYRDRAWLPALTCLSQVCASLGDAARAKVLYRLLQPFDGRCVVLFAAVYTGPVSYYLGLLAATMSRWDDAERHFADAAAKNAEIGARPRLARTQYDYAAMLLSRNAPGDREKALDLVTRALGTAHELGMKSLVERCLALKLQGADGPDGRGSIVAVRSTILAERPDVSRYAAPDGKVTILFTDIEGSVALNERLGDESWMTLLRQHNAIVTDQVAAHEGTVVKSIGDGFMAAFPSPRRALRCAIAVQRAIAKMSTSSGAELCVRIGLHVGDVVRENNDFFGLTVNRASRIAEAACGREILVSSALRELVDVAEEFRFGETSELELKSLPGKQAVCCVLW